MGKGDAKEIGVVGEEEAGAQFMDEEELRTLLREVREFVFPFPFLIPFILGKLFRTILGGG